MAERKEPQRGGNDDTILQQQFMRAISSFEGIMLSQIDLKNKLADRLNYSIRAGLIILGLIAVSILILLLTLSSQINRISAVASAMNNDFSTVSAQMEQISRHMTSMERRVALLQQIEGQVGVMEGEMERIAGDLEAMQGSVGRIGNSLTTLRGSVGNLSATMDRLGVDVLNMGGDVNRMGRGARALNRMMPLP